MEIVMDVEQVALSIFQVMQQFKNEIDDVFYDYKDDEDLTFAIFIDFDERATALATALDKVPHVETGVVVETLNRDTCNVMLTVATLSIKEQLVAVLHNNGWRPNGG